MSNEFFNNYQYDSCVSRGICSISPITSSLQSVLIMYLKHLVRLSQNSVEDEKCKDLILNILPTCVSNPEFSENTFWVSLRGIKDVFVNLNKIQDLSKEEQELFNETFDIVKAIRYGEKIFLNAQKNIPQEIRDLYNIMLVVAKNIAINLLDLESFGKSCGEGYLKIVEILKEINLSEKVKSVLKDIIFDAVKIDKTIMFQIRKAQEERYGAQTVAEVSYSTTSSKAVLVVGSNIRELEMVLDKLNDEPIDVYTHDDMMLAHTFPKFSEFKNLKGQFGEGLENCILDFATFPGPIILTKHSLHNIENLYRGRLFTTDFTCPKGVVRISNSDFSDVILSAKESKGFKTGRQCESLTIGFDYEQIKKEIEEKTENAKQVFLIGMNGFSITQKKYFDKLVKLAPQGTLIISFSNELNSENVININTCFDSYSMIRIFDLLQDKSLPVSVFVPKCDRTSISQMLYFKTKPKTNVFVGVCTPIILNPSLMNTLKEEFRINPMTSVKKDMEIICLFG